jgi:hypothetical protein
MPGLLSFTGDALILLVVIIVVAAGVWALTRRSEEERNRPLPPSVQERLAAVARKEKGNGNQ